MNAKELPLSSRRLLRLGQGVAIAGLLLFAGVVCFWIYSVFFNPGSVDAMIKENLTGLSVENPFPQWILLLGLALLILSSMSGILGLWVAFCLFAAYLNGDVFSERSAKKIRVIGWMIFLIAPLDLFANTIGTAIISGTMTDSVNISIHFEEGDFYSIVFGLLLVTIGQVMVQAAAIHAENKAFI